MDVPSEIDPNFEPQLRARSNTWPCRPIEDFAVDGQQQSPASDETGSGDHTKEGLARTKTSSRRNAWGNLSYADLITKAIQGSPEQRLTLSQIYDWMVQNVPYFKDKGDSTSSAGWKNSIRHNLSLHSRFMRIQNEGTGKSSWWVINPDAKPGKAPRRRAGSMETKSLEKKRGRIKKRVEAIRAAQENGTLSKEDFSDLHYSLSLSPEFRTRAGSNASSCGRLSPIQAAVEPDLHDGQVPPMSPIPWGTELDTDDNYTNSSEGGYTLVDSLVGSMNLSESGNISTDLEMLASTIKQEHLSGGSLGQYSGTNNYDERYTNLPAPPSYNDHLQKQSSQQSTVLNLDRMVIQNREYMGMQPKQQQGTGVSVYSDNMYPDNSLHMMSQQQGMPSPGSNTLGVNTQQINQSPGRSPQLSPNYSSQHQAYSPQVHSPQLNKRISPQPVQNQQQQLSSQQLAGNRSLLQQCLEAPNDSLLRQALTQTNAPYQQNAVPQNRGYAQYNGGYTSSPTPPYTNMNNINNNLQHSMGQINMGHGPTQQISMTASGQVGRNPSNQDIADIDTENMLDLDYDVEQLLRHEIAMDPNLDFNFDNQSNQTMSTSESRNLVR